MEIMVYIHSAAIAIAVYYLILLYKDVQECIARQEWFANELHALRSLMRSLQTDCIKQKVATAKKVALPKTTTKPRKVKQ
jgi:hypothetical protein